MKKIDFIIDANKTKMPIIAIYEGTFKGLCFLLDTGCTDSVIFEFAVR